MIREAAFMAKAKWFPWAVPEAVRFAIGMAAVAWAGLCLVSFGVIVAAHLWSLKMALSLAMNALLVCAAVWQMPYRACKHCGKRRNQPLEGT